MYYTNTLLLIKSIELCKAKINDKLPRSNWKSWKLTSIVKSRLKKLVLNYVTLTLTTKLQHKLNLLKKKFYLHPKLQKFLGFLLGLKSPSFLPLITFCLSIFVSLFKASLLLPEPLLVHLSFHLCGAMPYFVLSSQDLLNLTLDLLFSLLLGYLTF